jgi:radical SAM protein with 4Fe4S-binding SPASM domain
MYDWSMFFKIAKSARALKSVSIELTNKCNAACPLCPTGADTLERDKGYISLELFRKITDEITGLGRDFRVTSYNYGEPFLHPKWFDLFEMLRSPRIFHKTSTNGLVFYKPESVDKLAHSHLHECILSIDGPTKELNAIYRKNVDLDKIYSGLHTYMAKYRNKPDRPKIIIQTVLFPFNKDELQNIKNKFALISDGMYYKHPNFGMTEYIDNREINTSTSQQVVERTPSSCSIFSSSFVVNWNGQCNPCCHDYKGKNIIGDANTQTLQEIFTSHPAQRFANGIREGRTNEICRNCPVDRRKNHVNNIYPY